MVSGNSCHITKIALIKRITKICVHGSSLSTPITQYFSDNFPAIALPNAMCHTCYENGPSYVTSKIRYETIAHNTFILAKECLE